MVQEHCEFRFLDGNVVNDWHVAAERVGADTPVLRDVVFDAVALADSAGLFFRGYYPIEAPYFSWGEMIPLAWKEEYWQESGDGKSIATRAIGVEVAQVLAVLAGSLSERPEPRAVACTYHSKELCSSPKSKMQGLAVETMWSVDQCLQQMLGASLPAAMRSLSLAYQNLFECTCQAQLILGFASENARAAALARHRENHAMKAEVWRWYEQNHDKFKSMDAAAAAVAGKIVPVAFRTARGWIGECAKRLRSARTP